MNKKYLALDIGDVRIGVARSDALGMFAHPLEVIDRRKTKAVQKVKELCQAEGTFKVIVGIPKSLDNTEKAQAEKVREFIEKLKKKIPKIDIIEIDERYSTTIAHRILTEGGNKGAKNQRKVVDKVAAAVILQTYLDQLK